MPVAHCVSSTTGIILEVDDVFCRLLQRPQQELIGISYRVITAADDLRKSSEMLQGLVDKAAPTHLRKRYVRPDGSLAQADLLVSKFSGQGRLISTLSWTEDDRRPASPSTLWRTALQLKHLYGIRIEEFGRDLFSDQVGLILLHAYLAEAEGRMAAVSEISTSIGLPVDTAFRWVRLLVQRDLVTIVDEAPDYIQLTHDGMSKLERLFSATLQSVGLPAHAC